MNNLGDYLEDRAKQLDLSRADELAAIQATLDGWYPGKTKAKSLQKGVLVVWVNSSVLANELRYKQADVVSKHPEVSRIVYRH